jgi:hypothetical protein
MPIIKLKVRSGLDVGDNTGTILATGKAKDRWVESSFIANLAVYGTTGATFRYADPSRAGADQVVVNDAASAIATSANA